MTFAGIIIVCEPITFQRAFELRRRFLSQSIWRLPRNGRGWFQSAHGGATASPHGWSAAVLALVEHDQVDVAAVAL